MIENESPRGIETLSALYPRVGKALRIGVTGPPGAGKSTLVEKLTAAIRRENKTVAIVAVDPTSPFSGGAILGDRVRMSSLFTDPGVFIRSMATRGSLGGLASKTNEVCDLLDAFGKDVIIIETVGVGQAELDIVQAAHSTLVVLVPESGDGIQAMKAGLMEIGDLFAVNKADREGADRLVVEIEMMLEMCKVEAGWSPRVIKTVAVQDEGVDELIEGLRAHHEYLVKNDLMKALRKRAVKSAIREHVEQKFNHSIWKDPKYLDLLEKYTTKVLSGNLNPYDASDRMWSAWNTAETSSGKRSLR